eukprot:COSAG04_NODE_9631_length_846_cov_0.987952_2_plen_92_part_00
MPDLTRDLISPGTGREAQKAIAAAGGFTWNNFNCMLTKEGGFGGSPVDLFACGLAKSEGYPRANNTEAAPVKEERLGDARKGCAAWCGAGP